MASGDGSTPREPQLITHQSAQGGYNYYGSGDPDGDPYDDGYSDDGYGDDYGDDRYGDDGYRGDHDDHLLDPDDEMSARKSRRKMIWRRVRRTCYVAAALMFLVGGGVFAYGYSAWPVPDPEALAAKAQQTVTINYANGEELTKIKPPEGGSLTMIRNLNSEVSKPMRDATLAAEDASFYSNWGFSIKGILIAVKNQVSGGAGGGSTITQQYVKLALDKDDATYTRKIKEVVVAFKVTNMQTKDDILKAYLNTAYYGRGANGIHAAADAYFGKLPKDLNPSEAAVLAGMVQRPTDNDPRVSPEQGKDRWDYVAGQMKENGFVTPEEFETMKLPTTLPRDAWRGDGVTGSQYHIRAQVKAELEREGYDEGMLSQGGFTITTTIDPNAQRMAEDAVNKITQGQPDNLKTALVAVDPKTGGVQAYYGGGSKVGGFDYANAAQEPGSAFKPFVALAGLEQGRGIGENWDGTSPQVIAGTPFENSRNVKCAVPNQCGVREAMTESVNTVFVNMATQFGGLKVQEAAYEAGIPQQIDGKPTLRNSDGNVDAGIALGQYPVRTVDMASAYGTFANDGMRVPPRFVAKIQRPDGEVVREFASKPEPAFAADEGKDVKNDDTKNLAANVTETMLDVAKRAELLIGGNRPVAAKTGTHQYFDTDDNAKAWMVGYTPQISTAVSMSADDNGKVRPVKAAGGKAVYGSGLPGEIWQEFMKNYHANKDVKQFTKPKPIGQYEKLVPTFSTPPPPPSTTAPPPPTSMPPTSSSAPSSESSEPSESDPWDRPSGDPTETEDCGGLFPPPGCRQNGGDGPGSGGAPDSTP